MLKKTINNLELAISVLQVIRMAKLIYQSLRTFRLLHDSLLIVLTNGSGQFVIIHGWSILTSTPQFGHSNGVFNFEDTLIAINPTYNRAIDQRRR